MAARSLAHLMLAQEAEALLTRVERLRAFALQETMVPAAAPSADAQTAIEQHCERARRTLLGQVRGFTAWLSSSEGAAATPHEAQRRFTFLRLRFNTVLTQFDIFSEAMSQRSEAETGVWLAGLDVVARDALALPGYFVAPPVICYLARGPGAAIRRARTRLPGGDENPLAIVRVPRERMIGAGLASSLVHEVGHQGAALLQLVESLRAAFSGTPLPRGANPDVWAVWSRWLSEIVADFWAVAKVGIASTMGLIGVVSLPRAFVFRVDTDDPHPTPFIRVKLSAAIGSALYPHPQWDQVARMWDAFYPLADLDPARRKWLEELQQTLPQFVEFLVSHRPDSLKGKPLAAVMTTNERQPAALAALLRRWESAPELLRRAPPSLVFAVIGQARVDGTITPRRESEVLAGLLRHWALTSSLAGSARCAHNGRAHSTNPTVRHASPHAGEVT